VKACAGCVHYHKPPVADPDWKCCAKVPGPECGGWTTFPPGGGPPSGPPSPPACPYGTCKPQPVPKPR
jgi:hypothetical protein